MSLGGALWTIALTFVFVLVWNSLLFKIQRAAYEKSKKAKPITLRGSGTVSFIPGGGWVAAIAEHEEDALDKFSASSGDYDWPTHVARLPVIGWEMIESHRIEEFKDPDDEDEPPLEAVVVRSIVRAHCMHESGRYVVRIAPDDEDDLSGLIKFLAPGEDMSDDELLRMREIQRQKVRERRKGRKQSDDEDM